MIRAAALVLLLAAPAAAETLRVATFNTGLSARGPGLLLGRLIKGDDPEIDAAVAMIEATSPDILILQDIDFDAGGAALSALAERIEPPYPHRFALLPNTGMATGLDMDEDGRLGGPRDAQGFGYFAGDGGMAILSRFPIAEDEVRDLSDLLWRDLPGAIPPPLPEDVAEAQRLSSVGHWIVPVDTDQGRLTLMTWSATPPVFDGPEDRNGRRNRDETALWLRLLDGELAVPPPEPPFIIAGLGNVDPDSGEGRPDAISSLLGDPRLRDPAPTSPGAGRAGKPTDTVLFNPPTGPLRVSFVLPSADLTVLRSGVLWPIEDSPEADALGPLEHWPRHRLVWVDIALP
ncbi:Endonuclease/Exonuclease/phosphatase family protein [Palleronia marisminoris]|uniref:Endonuclease/exonuclease/phosphatase domain-containing protein n=1 Tax=Palleronia marisminoris TaxID=315423 RepID=A0A1Y5SLX5_9RHOB|nr:endonuclease/exonuclease/phosphatase family protein [Palleronia marisminoris]SFG89055.1 Endonuclease/Exonuclease/phosphatase family protein [Palleronia marisminoris]SLN43773.1 hypothetical protein PAM7066_01931 [Palleronia marisminoris]